MGVANLRGDAYGNTPLKKKKYLLLGAQSAVRAIVCWLVRRSGRGEFEDERRLLLNMVVSIIVIVALTALYIRKELHQKDPHLLFFLRLI